MKNHDPQNQRLVDLMLEKDRIEDKMKELLDGRFYGSSGETELDLVKQWNALQAERMDLEQDINRMVRRVRLPSAEK